MTAFIHINIIMLSNWKQMTTLNYCPFSWSQLQSPLTLERTLLVQTIPSEVDRRSV